MLICEHINTIDLQTPPMQAHQSFDLLSPSPAHPSSPSHSPLFSPLFSPALPSSPIRPSLIPPPLPPTSPPLTPHFSPDPLNFPTFCFPQAVHQLCFTLRSSPPSLSSLLLSPPLPCPPSTCLPALVLALCRGPGVVGQQPVLPPGASFEYTSVCPLDTRKGAMGLFSHTHAHALDLCLMVKWT
ncbi:unnamed protein product [Closterium sp. Naga37s-1]|nr:unnamed protein product [Closterium sp. Naga37s-1]